MYRSGELQSVVLQEEGGTVTFRPMQPPPASLEFKIALMLSLPAVFLGGLFSMWLPGEEERRMIGASILFVPLLWFSIGRWIDQLLAPDVSVHAKRFLRAAGRMLLRGITAFLLFCVFIALTFQHHHQSSDQAFLMAALGLWCGGYLACSILGERTLRKRTTVAG
jgi:hypothetical protein